MSIEVIEGMILHRLKNGPRHAKIFVHCKPVIARMVSQGELERVNINGGRGANYLQIKDKAHD